MRFIFIILCFYSFNIYAATMSGGGESLSAYLDSLDVEHKWQPGIHVDWFSGEPDGVAGGVTKSHCSAFAAAATARADVYLLRPPEHSEYLLANAQYDWLAAQGRTQGWVYVKDGYAAQRLANQGCLVVVAYKNLNVQRPGHVAIVHPSDKSDEMIDKDGPDITQAGLENYSHTTLLKGFSHHISSAQDHTIIYYGHHTAWCVT